MPDLTKSRVVVVGAGVFGLSTAWHLSKKGYTDVTVLDGQDLPSQHYSPDEGSKSASADINKVFRASYGEQVHYQQLAYESQKVWLEWNDEISRSAPADLPEGLAREDKLLDLCGMLRLSATGDLSAHEQATLRNFEAAGTRAQQFSLQDPEDRKHAFEDPAWKARYCVFGDPATPEAKAKVGVLDSTAGFVLMGNACLWLHHLCSKAGVKFVFGEEGKVKRFLTAKTASIQKIVGVHTAASEHPSDLVIVATGAFTPLLVPQTAPSATATAGSLITFQLPADRADLLDRFSPKRFPVVSWGSNGLQRNGLYILPRTKEGLLKFGFRGTKFTNLEQPDASTPIYPESVPALASKIVNETIEEFFPELKGIPVQSTRMCWYTDGPGDEFLVDYVPGYAGLFVATCGSGHGAKHMPMLGKYIVEIIEGNETPFNQFWKWKEGGARPSNLIDLKDA
ncbi:FAD dependent oxidoreductase [Calocera viscosa TUFC12733]|uniref:FAD dependent oxidoreductase n=1 Tax=Calocera viscosa (strain TUFC12733) TaxID=1330018 RepID=A0A167M657_CALVF|nr:FAD dependent oxidoreductase [Calocera viscosa TUFC12733]